MNAPITESVSLLARLEPGLLQRLRAENPQEHVLLAEGEEAGPGEEKTLKRGRIKTEVAIASVSAALKEYRRWFPLLRRRLALAQRASFVAQVLTLIAGASIFTSFAVEFPKVIKGICGVLALGGSIASLWSGHLLKPLGKDGSDLFDVYKRLAEAGARADILDRQLAGWSRSDGAAPEEVIASANETCQIINQLAPLFIDEDRRTLVPASQAS